MAVIINEIDQTYFEINSNRYYKTYQPLISGVENVAIVNIYDSRQILNSTKFDELVIDGVAPTSQSDAINKLLDIIFAAEEIATIGYLKNTTDNFTGTLNLNTGSAFSMFPTDNSFDFVINARTNEGGSLHQYKNNNGTPEAWRESWYDGSDYITAWADSNTFFYDARIENVGGITGQNPNNTTASVSLSWLNDVPRLRIGGTGAGSSSNLEIQGSGDTVRASFSSTGDFFAAGELEGDALTLTASGADATLISFDIERPWTIQQGSSGAATSLDFVQADGSKSMRIGSDAQRNSIQFYSGSGNIISQGTMTADNFILNSDRRLKQDIEPLKTTPIKATWKSYKMKGKNRVGVIAQELELEHPEFVETNEEGFKSVAYIDLLIAKVAELESRIKKAGL